MLLYVYISRYTLGRGSSLEHVKFLVGESKVIQFNTSTDNNVINKSDSLRIHSYEIHRIERGYKKVYLLLEHLS